jgi:hypothetical protein
MVYFGTGPGRGFSVKPLKPSRLNRPRQRLTVRGIVSTARAIDRVESPSAARKDDPRAQHVALFRRGRPHPSLKHRTILRRQPDFRSFGNLPMLNHESAFSETGY